MNSRTLNRIRQQIIESEKQPENPYLDIKRNVTIGTGFKIDKEEDFLKLPLVNKHTGKPATDQEKRRDWQILQREREASKDGKGDNRNAKSFREPTNTRMLQAEQDKRLNAEIDTRVGKLRRDIGADAWDKLTDGQKAAAVDIHYANGSLDKFPKYKDALKAGDADAMARESLFFTDRENGKRDEGRLKRNLMAITGDDEKAAQGRLQGLISKKQDQPTADVNETGKADDPARVPDAKPESARKQLIDDLTLQDNPMDEIIQKKPADLTEDEVGHIMRAKGKARTDDEKRKLHNMASDFFKAKYGTGEAKRDETGRLLDPAPIAPINKKPVPVTGTDGKPLLDTVTALAKRVSEAVGRDGRMETVKALQDGLNILQSAKTGNTPLPFPQLKTDGIAGPKTRMVFQTATRDVGPEKVEEGAALGRFHRFADTVARGKASGDVKTVTETSFGTLFRYPSRNAAPKSTEEGSSLQATLNDLGPRKLGGAFTPLKEDGEIGPKTTAAFRQVLPAVGAKDFTRKLGGHLGFLD